MSAINVREAALGGDLLRDEVDKSTHLLTETESEVSRLELTKTQRSAAHSAYCAEQSRLIETAAARHGKISILGIHERGSLSSFSPLSRCCHCFSSAFFCFLFVFRVTVIMPMKRP
jgi:hypothetical protein